MFRIIIERMECTESTDTHHNIEAGRLTLKQAVAKVARYFHINSDVIAQRIEEFVTARLKKSADPTDIKYAAQLIDQGNPVTAVETIIGKGGAKIARIHFGEVPRIHLVGGSVFELLFCNLPIDGVSTPRLIVRNPDDSAVKISLSHFGQEGPTMSPEEMDTYRGGDVSPRRIKPGRQQARDTCVVRPNRSRLQSRSC